MPLRTDYDCFRESYDPLEMRFLAIALESSERVMRYIVELGLVLEHKLLQNLLFGVEVMVEAAGENAALIGNFLKTDAKAGRCKQPGRRFENLGPTGNLARSDLLSILRQSGAIHLTHFATTSGLKGLKALIMIHQQRIKGLVRARMDAQVRA
jgi:hypothetical protein